MSDLTFNISSYDRYTVDLKQLAEIMANNQLDLYDAIVEAHGTYGICEHIQCVDDEFLNFQYDETELARLLTAALNSDTQ